MTFGCEWHFDAGGSRCFECVFIHERHDVCEIRRNGKVVKVIIVVTQETIRFTLHIRGRKIMLYSGKGETNSKEM